MLVPQDGTRSPNPSLSIVVTSFTLDRLDDVTNLLRSIRDQACPGLETVFVAEQSPDLARRVRERAARLSLPVRVLVNDGEAGVGVCRNMGIVASAAEVVALVDDDTILFPGWAQEMIQSYSLDPDVVGITGPAIPLWEDDAMSWFPREFYWMWGGTVWDWDQVREIRNVGGMNCSFKREVLLQAGLYLPHLGPKGGDERSSWFGSTGEEVELSLRIRSRFPGAKIIYSPGAKVYHKVYRSRFNWRFMAKRAFSFGYAKRYLETLFRDDFRNQPVLHLERDHLRHILLKMLPSLAREAFRSPLSAWRKATVALIGTFFAGLGYLTCFVRPGTERRGSRRR